jgi:hypothetical protein
MEFWLTFETDNQGRATALVIRPGVMNLRAKRIE